MTSPSPEDRLNGLGVEEIDPRGKFLLKNWLTLKLPPRDYLLGSVMCTTSRWLIFGETGVGKTILGLCGLAGAMASGLPIFNWNGQRRARILYLDGEMPAETFKERMQLTARIWGEDLLLYGYNRDLLPSDAMPPLNTEEGQKWFWKEVDLIQPDAVFFDSIMCLLQGPLTEEETWSPVKPFVRQISGRRIAQVWLHHTGHDTQRGYGTKTAQWEMDTVAGLSKPQDANPLATAMQIEFGKSRLRTPDNAVEFMPGILRLEEGQWTRDGAPSALGGKDVSMNAVVQRAILQVYERLSDDYGERASGFDGKPVIKVKVDLLREELRNRGYLNLDEKGRIDAASRQAFGRAKASLLGIGKLVEANGLIWKP
jgi:hypothetical protein